jgi:hypothetical protein
MSDPTGPVLLRITDPRDGRSAAVLMARSRAEALVDVGLGGDDRPFVVSIDPVGTVPEEQPVTYLKAALTWASTHKSEIAAAAAWLASTPLPTPYHQVAALAAAGLAALAGTKYRLL